MCHALAIAADSKALAIATDTLRDGYFSNSSRLDKLSKRARVQELGTAVAGSEDIYPLSATTHWSVAARPR